MPFWTGAFAKVATGQTAAGCTAALLHGLCRAQRQPQGLRRAGAAVKSLYVCSDMKCLPGSPFYPNLGPGLLWGWGWCLYRFRTIRSYRQKGEIFLLPSSLLIVRAYLLPPAGDTILVAVPEAEVVRALPYLQLITASRRAFFWNYADVNIARGQSAVLSADNPTSFPSRQ